MRKKKHPDSTKKLLCLDLDETLIHAHAKPFEHYQMIIKGDYMAVRPGVEAFLDRMAPFYDFMIWSNSGSVYVHDMLDAFWPQRHELKAIYTSALSKPHVENGYGIATYKEIWKISKRMNYRRGHIIALDDKPINFKFDYGNLIWADPFMGDPNDTHLMKVGNLLLNLAKVDNVRAVEKRWFKMHPQMYAAPVAQSPAGSDEGSPPLR
jgi:TFIIF-interacting CTD phosphatase-like protein